VATWDDVRRIALTLPLTTEDGGTWRVGKKGFVWERPLRKADLAALGDTAPTGPILGARVPDEGAKQALLAEQPEVYFVTPHFDGYPAILVNLDAASVTDLDELIVEAWLVQAPKRVATAYLATR
jgi:hypothetical protein